jgi:hypothetical protein
MINTFNPDNILCKLLCLIDEGTGAQRHWIACQGHTVTKSRTLEPPALASELVLLTIGFSCLKAKQTQGEVCCPHQKLPDDPGVASL